MPIIYIYTLLIYNDTSCIIWVWVNTYRYILVGWTSIYQLFWGSLGTRVLTHPHMYMIYVYITYSVCYIPVGRPRVFSIDRKGASGATAHGGVVTTNGDGARDDEAGPLAREERQGDFMNEKVDFFLKNRLVGHATGTDWLPKLEVPTIYIYIYPYIRPVKGFGFHQMMGVSELFANLYWWMGPSR